MSGVCHTNQRIRRRRLIHSHITTLAVILHQSHPGSIYVRSHTSDMLAYPRFLSYVSRHGQCVYIIPLFKEVIELLAWTIIGRVATLGIFE